MIAKINRKKREFVRGRKEVAGPVCFSQELVISDIYTNTGRIKGSIKSDLRRLLGLLAGVLVKCSVRVVGLLLDCL